MIKQHTHDPEPDGVVERFIRGDEVTLYFADDTEVIAKKQAQENDRIFQERYKAKVHRATVVAEIKVTTSAGNTFDGDEISQNRMAKVIVSMDDMDIVTWTLADNTIKEISKAELIEALKLAGKEQSKLWRIR